MNGLEEFSNAFMKAVNTDESGMHVHAIELPSQAQAQFNYYHHYLDTIKKEPESKTNIQFTSAAKYSHTEILPLESLEPTDLECIAKKVSYIHVDKVLFLQVQGPTPACRCFPSSGTYFLVRDTSDRMLTAGIYNYVMPKEDPTHVFPIGQYLALLQPYMKHPYDDIKNPVFLRCDNPNGVILFSTKHDWLVAQGKQQQQSISISIPISHQIKTIEKIGQDGTRTYKSENYSRALRIYSDAIMKARSILLIEDNDKVSDLLSTLLFNRLKCHIHLDNSEAALVDCDDVLKRRPNHKKALKCRIECLLLARRFDEVINTITDVAITTTDKGKNEDEEDEDKEIKKWKQSAIRALKEKNDVSYDEWEMLKEVDSNSGLVTGVHADYFSSSIILSTENCIAGRGIKAISNIPSNTILVVSKAFSYVLDFAKNNNNNNNNNNRSSSSSSNQNPTDIFVKLNSNKLVDMNSSVLRLPLVMKKLEYMPIQDRTRFFQLTSGSLLPIPNEIDNIPLQRVSGILACNSWGTCNSTYIQSRCEEVSWRTSFLNSDREPNYSDILQWRDEHKFNSNGSGLWIEPSLFNHSCIPNCIVNQSGDYMFIRTNRDINKNEELYVKYVDILDSFSDRVITFNNWGEGGNASFICNCPRCTLCRDPCSDYLELEENTKKLCNDIMLLKTKDEGRLLTLSKTVNKKLKNLIQRYEKLNPEYGIHFTYLLDIQAGVHINANEYKQAIEILKLERIIRIASGINETHVEQYKYLNIAGCYIPLHQLDEAYRYIKLSRELCGDYLKKPSTAAFILMCLTYVIVPPQYHDILRQLASSVDFEYYEQHRKKITNNNTTIMICLSCYVPTTGLVCSKCKKARYCSKSCQKQDWKIHKNECC